MNPVDRYIELHRKLREEGDEMDSEDYLCHRLEMNTLYRDMEPAERAEALAQYNYLRRGDDG